MRMDDTGGGGPGEGNAGRRNAGRRGPRGRGSLRTRGGGPGGRRLKSYFFLPEGVSGFAGDWGLAKSTSGRARASSVKGFPNL